MRAEIKSRQAVVEFVIPHLVKQKQRSGRDYFGNVECLYRGEHGRKCAIGWLIPDEDYDKSFDDGTFTIEDVAEKSDFSHLPFAFLEELQELHDNTILFDFDSKEFKNRAKLWLIKQKLPIEFLDDLEFNE